MKKATLKGVFGVAALVLLSSCNEEMTFTEAGTGTISPLVDFDPSVVTSRSARAVSEIGDLTVNDLTLTLQSADGSLNESFAYAEFPTDRGFRIGDYTLTATYGDPAAEGFNLPAVNGSCALTVSEGRAAKPSIEAKPSKAMVSIKYDESLTDYMTSVAATVHSAGGAYVEYPATETRPAYLKPGNVTVSVAFTKPNGTEGNLQVAEFEAQAQHHYYITAKLGGSGAGVLEGITIEYDDMLEKEDVTVDISDEVLSIPAPVVTPVGFTPGEAITIVDGTVSADLRPQINIMARGGIQSAKLTTVNCPSLTDAGWPAEVDLANLTAAQLATMTGLGLNAPGLTKNPDRQALVDFTQVITHIAPRNSALAPSEFTLVVTDKQGKQSEPVTLGVKVERLELSVSYDDVYAGEPTIDLNVNYNGVDIQNNLKVSYLNNNGVFAPATISGVREARSAYVVTSMSPLTLCRPSPSRPPPAR